MELIVLNILSQIRGIINQYLLPVLDIITMTLIIFYIYLFIKKSKAAELAKGLLIVLVVLFIFTLIGFPVISWLFDKLLYNILILIIIIFSPEIREILMNVGKDSTKALKTQEDEDAMQTLVSSILKLSQRKDGAIFVFARKDNLFNIISSYVVWDSSISEDVILFLFDKRSIFHDGAVIIDQNLRIKAVSAILPLSDSAANSGKLEKHIGTRHRAGLGISEKSDSLALVVSEETGNISIFDDGEPYLNIPAENVKATLLELLYKKGEDIEDREEDEV